LVTVRFRVPSEAARLIASDAVSCVELTTATDPAVIPSPAATVVAPKTKSVPVIVTVVDFPRAIDAGDTAVIFGTGLFTVKPPASVALPPPGNAFTTDTSLAPPSASDAMVIRPCTWLPLRTETESTVIPLPKLRDVTPDKKPVPVTTTFSVCPLVCDSGAMLAMVGDGLTTEKAPASVAVPPPGEGLVTETE